MSSGCQVISEEESTYRPGAQSVPVPGVELIPVLILVLMLILVLVLVLLLIPGLITTITIVSPVRPSDASRKCQDEGKRRYQKKLFHVLLLIQGKNKPRWVRCDSAHCGWCDRGQPLYSR